MPFKHIHALERHFVRHGAEFGAKTVDEYGKMAETFLMGSIPAGVKECIRKSDGARVRFDPATNAIGTVGSDGKINTFMIYIALRSSTQTAEQYFESQCK